MNAVYDSIRTLVPVRDEFSGEVVPAGTLGTIVEAYSEPVEGYAVDLAIPDRGVGAG